MEKYDNFIKRINLFEYESIPNDKEDLKINDHVKSKVNKNGTFKSFYGDTIIFDLSAEQKGEISYLADIVNKEFNMYLAEPLKKNTFHMTLHDLNNSNDYKIIEPKMKKNREESIKICKEIADELKEIKMISTCAFNMINSSIGLGLKPINEGEWMKLQKIHDKFDRIVKLEYPLFPHITLAYYGRSDIPYMDKMRLAEVLESISKKKININLNTEELNYTTFTSMNDYTSHK